jgi:Tfp pilus assembly protein PilN
MVSLNFVPDDYVQNNESRRVNILCVVLVLVVVGALSAVFGVIKVRQRASAAQEVLVYAKMNQMQQSLVQFEQLQIQRENMMKSALTIADLLESVPRSIVLAQLTNALPFGASLTTVDITQKEADRKTVSPTKSKYKAAKAKEDAGQVHESQEKNLITEVTITGLATSDLQVASYIKSLEESLLLGQVVLVESKEHEIENEVFRQFQLEAKLTRDAKLSSEAMEVIRGHAKKTINRF